MATPWDEVAAVVLDNGSGNIKCGFAGDDVPRSVFGAVTSHPRGSPSGPWLVGDDALNAKGQVYKYPIEHGIVTDWDGLERLWAHAFRELQVEPSDQAVLITEAPMNPTKNREKMAELMFETFQVPGLHFQIQAVLTMYSAGRTDGLVLDSGDGITHAVPIFEGHTIPGSVGRSDIAGRDLTEWMMELLSDETDRPFATSGDREVARTIKEKHCRVSQDFDADFENVESGDDAWKAQHTVAYTLPDGSDIRICKSTFCCPELLFNPQIAEKESVSLQTLVHDAVQRCPIDLRRTLYGTILLSGGTTMFPGLETRLQHEVSKLCNARVADDVRVIAPNERKFSVWMGAAILSTLASFASEWVTAQEYHESGPQVVHRRCVHHAYGVQVAWMFVDFIIASLNSHNSNTSPSSSSSRDREEKNSLGGLATINGRKKTNIDLCAVVMASSPMAAAVHKLTSELDACRRRIRKLERENDQLRRQVASNSVAETQPVLLEAPSVSSVSGGGTPPNNTSLDEASCLHRRSQQASLSTFSPNPKAHQRGVSVDLASDCGGDSIAIGLSSSFGQAGPPFFTHSRSQSYDPLHLGGTVPSLNASALHGSISGGLPSASGVHSLRRRVEALERREESWKEQVAMLSHQLDALRNEKDEQLIAVQRNAEDLVTQLQQAQQQLQVLQMLQESRAKRSNVVPWSPMSVDGGSTPNGVSHLGTDGFAHMDAGGSLSGPDSKSSSLTAKPGDLERSVSNRKRSKSMVVLKQKSDGSGGQGELFAELPKEDLEEDIFMTHANHVRTLSNNLVPMSAIVSGAASFAPSGPSHAGGEGAHGSPALGTGSGSVPIHSPATSCDARGPITNPNQLGDAFPEGVKDKRWYVHRVVRMALKRALSNDVGFRTMDMIPLASPTSSGRTEEITQASSALPSLQGKPLSVVNMMVKEAFELHYYIKDNAVVQSDAEVSNLPPFHKQNSDPILLQHFSSSSTGTTASSVDPATSSGTTFPRINARSDQIRVIFTGLTLFSYIRAFLHFDIDMFLRSVEDAMWRESTSPGKSDASMYFFGNYVIKSVKESEYRFLKDAYLGMFARYAELNPHTLISRIYSLFSVYFVKKGTRRHYILMNNVFWTKHYINRIFDIKGSSVGRDADCTAGHRTAFGALLLKDNDLPLQLIICGPMKRATLLAQLRSDTSFLASLSVVDYSCIIGIRTRVFSRENRHREQQQRASAAFDTEVFSFTAADGGILSLPIYAENDSTTVREDTYYIGLIDVLQTYTPQKRLEHFAKGLLRDKHAISIVPPGEFSERLCKLLERITV